jgi:octaprenyl-diphosphate synthase
MKEGKLTLPVLYALNSANNANISNIARKVKRGDVSDVEVKTLVDFTKEMGGIKYAEKVMNDYADKAKALLDVYPDSDVKDALCKYVDFVVGRSF